MFSGDNNAATTLKMQDQTGQFLHAGTIFRFRFSLFPIANCRLPI
jgi:hypothetical protein